MAKGKFEYWRTEDGLTLLEGWARDGMRDEDMAGKIGISKTTFYEWQKRFPEIHDALKEGKELPDYRVENKLYELCLEGNVTAIIFWLKNRRQDKWRDRQDINGRLEIPKLEDVL